LGRDDPAGNRPANPDHSRSPSLALRDDPMALPLSPVLRFGPGGDFLSDVFADRFAPESSVSAGESGNFDPNSPGSGPGQDLDGRVPRRPSDSFLAGQDERVSPRSGYADGLSLSDLARRAGGLLVAQRLIAAQANALRAASALVTSMLATIQRASEPPRTLRHEPNRKEPARAPDFVRPVSSSTLRPRASSAGDQLLLVSPSRSRA